ncbi:MAG TPA: FecR family protein [Stellaceae bacterium]|nr:FecR family protein [Stellaceae bacterium]
MQPLRWLIPFLAIGLLAAPAAAQNPEIALVEKASGKVTVLRDGHPLRLRAGDPLYQKDVVETGPDGSVGITFNDNTVFSTGPNSQLALDQFQFDPGTAHGAMLAELRKGTLSVVSGEIPHGSPGAMKIKTPNAVLGVRGTTFAVRVY